MANKAVANGVPHPSRTIALARQASLRSSAVDHSSLATEQPVGVHDERVDYDALIRHFECPVCHEWITPPIVQCRKGHVICGPCKSSGLKICPVCKQRFSDVPNWMMEQVSALIAFPCKFQSQGCRSYSILLHKTAHEAICSFRPIACAYASRGCTQVLQFHQMEHHVLQCRFKPVPLKQQWSAASRDSN